jgi:hypothetical protein
LQAERSPGDPEAQAAYERARVQSEETDAAQARAREEPASATRFQAPEDLKRLFREMAKKVHPDLASDDADRERRTRLMAALNAAFQAGDRDRMLEVRDAWEERREEASGAALVERLRQKIEGLERRLVRIREEAAAVRGSDLWQLKERVEAEESSGRDLLDALKTAVDQEIELVRKQVGALR